MTTFFSFTHFGLNIRHTFEYCVNLKGFIIGKLVWLYCSDNLQNNKTNMIKSWIVILLAEGDRDCALVTPFSPLPLRRPVYATAYEYVIYLLYESVLIFEQLKEQKNV